jgi:putative addiction module CopG family antidote
MSRIIPADLCDFVNDAVATGVYRDESAVVAEALRLLKQREALRREVQIGVEQLESGDFKEYDEAGLKRRFEVIKAWGRNRLQVVSSGRKPLASSL